MSAAEAAYKKSLVDFHLAVERLLDLVAKDDLLSVVEATAEVRAFVACMGADAISLWYERRKDKAGVAA